jgi:hypothetical protein
MQDAQAAGLTGKDNWRKFPRNMLFARALSNGVRWYAPDIFNGATVYTPDELGAAEDDDGNVVVTEQPAQIQPMTYEQAAARLTPSGRRYDELSLEQLNFIISSDKASAESREAARIVLKHDFNAEPPAQENE